MNPWGNSSQFIVEWHMKYSEFFTVYIDVETDAGHRFLTYKPLDYDGLGQEKYIHIGLGEDLTDGQWHRIIRDLRADLENAQPGVNILEVNGFLIRGSGLVDDIKLHYEDLDTDNDGLDNHMEKHMYGTDPDLKDTDIDGISDGDELAFWGESWGNDNDADGLINLLDSDSDGDGYTDGQEVQVGTNPTDQASKPNQPPVTDAGSDQNCITGQKVTLDGSNSCNPDEAIISFSWSFMEVPVQSSLTEADFSDVNSAKPTFTPVKDGVYIIRLEVSDGTLATIDDVAVFASSGNVAPNADAGPDQSAATGSPVYLNANQSADPDNGPEALSYLWTFGLLPDESLLTDDDIAGIDLVNVSFVPDVDGVYELNLTVSDGDLVSGDVVQVIADTGDVPPNAEAGNDLSIYLGKAASLDGTASNDPDGSPESLSHNWRFVSLPLVSQLTNEDIFDADTASPFFTPDVIGTYVLEVRVYDGQDYDYDNVAVTGESVHTIDMNLSAGWNMISLPLDPSDKRLNILFPKAVVVYGYEKGRGYVWVKPDDDLAVGKGYWILMDQATSYTITGQPIQSYTHPVYEDGWIMIGGCTHPPQVVPHGCNIALIYGYVLEVGYQRVLASEPFERGKGYWIFINNAADEATITVETVH